MKLTTFVSTDQKVLPGVITKKSNEIIDIGSLYPDLLECIKNGEEALKKIEQFCQTPQTTYLLDEIKFLSPLPIPESIRDCMAFEQHIINCTRKLGLGKLAFIDEAIEKFLGRKYSIAYAANKAWYQRPIYYKSNRFSVVGNNAEIIIPSYAGEIDYELEWGVIIGKQGKNIKKEEAGDYIAGYTIFNDFSVRQTQLAEMKGRLGPSKGKDFDTGNAIGPWLVTKDEIEDPYNLSMQAIVNGETWSEGTTKDMYWSFEEIIEYISQSETLYPGEFIGSGTCSGQKGMGCGLEHGRFLKPGDTIELHVEKFGTLKNKIIANGSEAECL